MATNPSDRAAEAHSFFCRNLAVIHHILTRVYKLAPHETVRVEQNLYDWFDRSVDRPGPLQIPVTSLRLPLLAAACRAGLVSVLCKLDGKPCEDQDFRKLLAREPDEVAFEIEKKLQRKTGSI